MLYQTSSSLIQSPEYNLMRNTNNDDMYCECHKILSELECMIEILHTPLISLQHLVWKLHSKGQS